jgi:hypothetical protein
LGSWLTDLKIVCKIPQTEPLKPYRIHSKPKKRMQ